MKSQCVGICAPPWIDLKFSLQHNKTDEGIYCHRGVTNMQVENIYPACTTAEEWDDLATIAAKLLTAMAATLQESDGMDFDCCATM